MKYLLVILLFMMTATAHGQISDKTLVQVSGVTYNSDSVRQVVPYVNITNLRTGRQVYISNYLGYFSFTAHEQDSLRFTSVGYNPATLVVPSGVNNQSMVISVKLQAQIINLPMVRIFPWATVDEFRKSFLALKIPDDDLETAKKNLSMESIQAMRASMPRTGREGFSIQDFHNSIVNSHSITNPLLNPFAWGSLVRDIAAGDKANSGK
ncbi:hypothetical protein [Mucilaginibacter antarcticus]|uniref:Carboxypeptidase-like protein n=1 Tax=Mucilaginibacter antarcticus TaxID=1855725 RepID=A0ABW5XMI3_9SPHI